MIAPVLYTLLTLTQTNGTVAPAFRHTTTCNIQATNVTVETYGPTVDFPHPTVKKIRFNNEIPNAAVLESLINDASRGQMSSGVMPIGGARTSYIAHLGRDAQFGLKLMFGNKVYSQNMSASAKKLVRFMNLNCNMQQPMSR